ncbi:MAG: PEP-CTERM sorting domain-containing protein [Akkermansia sp.]
MKHTFIFSLCLLSATSFSQAATSILFDLGTNTDSNSYTNGADTWNKANNKKIGAGNDARPLTINNNDSMIDSTGRYKIDNKIGISIQNSGKNGIWGATGDTTAPSIGSGITASTTETTKSTISCNNGAVVTFTISGLTEGSTYTLALGGGATSPASFDLTTNNFTNGSSSVTTATATSTGALTPTLGTDTATGKVTVDNQGSINPSDQGAWAVEWANLVADKEGNISFTIQRTAGDNQSMNAHFDYLTFTSDSFTTTAIVPEPSIALMGALGLGGLLLRRKK